MIASNGGSLNSIWPSHYPLLPLTEGITLFRARVSCSPTTFSPLVRKELIITLSKLVREYSDNCKEVAIEMREEMRLAEEMQTAEKKKKKELKKKGST